MPRPFLQEFRQRALELVRSGRSVVEVAVLLGIAQSCLYRWEKQDLIDRGLKPQRAGPVCGIHRGTAEDQRPRGGEQDPPQSGDRSGAGGVAKRVVPSRGRAPR